jgi:hypothetical protein
MDVPREEESVGRSTYESLVRLSFLCGRGLDPEELVRRFIVAIRPSIPASGVWLFQGQKIIAVDKDPGEPEPAPPGPVPPGLAPQYEADGTMSAVVLPGMVLICRLSHGSVQRGSDVVALFARILALAWQAESVSRDEPWDDDYLAAKSIFKRRWLRQLVRRHDGNISAAARAANLSRATLYAMMRQVGVSVDDEEVVDPAALKGGTTRLRRAVQAAQEAGPPGTVHPPSADELPVVVDPPPA